MIDLKICAKRHRHKANAKKKALTALFFCGTALFEYILIPVDCTNVESLITTNDLTTETMLARYRKE